MPDVLPFFIALYLLSVPLPEASPVPSSRVVYAAESSKHSWIGGVSYYSQAGCVGCSKNQITASGEPFNENAMTLAFNWLPLRTHVRVTNLDNGTSVVAKVNDRHGAYNARHKWRIADLSLGLARAIGAKTDVSRVKIGEL